MDLSAIIDEFNKRKAQAGQGIGDMLGLQKKPADWFQQMQQGQNAVITPEQRSNVHKELADIAERMAQGMVPPMIRERERAMRTDPSAAAKPFTSEEIKQATPFVTAAAPIAYHGTPHTWGLGSAEKTNALRDIPAQAGKNTETFYHVTTPENAAKIKAEGISPGDSGKTFLTDAGSVGAIGKHWLGGNYEAIPVQLPKSSVSQAKKIIIGTEGGKDVLATEFYTKVPISPRGDASKIGTGQGAQSYGHGLYFAENPDVAKTYSPAFSGRAEHAQKMLNNIAERKAAGGESAEHLASMEKYWKDEIAKQGQASMYQVNIPDQHAARMLDWDKPLSEQAPEVKTALSKFKFRTNDDPTGEQIYRRLQESFPSKGYDIGEQSTVPGEQASALLHKYGIPGIKYLDQGSRVQSWVEQSTGGKWRATINTPMGASKSTMFDSQQAAEQFVKQQGEQGTRNFVVFDPAILEDVTRK